ncbi:MAG: DUF4296 domain-containing protein [Cryomorphaceae bacterium]|nr:DUF4296 domain-containing protein [Cryomorphaceae bacterium]
MVLRWIFIVSSCLFLGSCKVPPIEPPETVLDEDAMVRILEDMYLAEGGRVGGNRMFDDLLIGDYYDMIFEKHQIDSVYFSQTMDFYNINPELMLKIHDRVIRRLMERDAAMEAIKKEISDSIIRQDSATHTVLPI